MTTKSDGEKVKPPPESEDRRDNTPEAEQGAEIDEEEQLRRKLEESPYHVDSCQRLVTLLRQRDQDLQAIEVLEQGAARCLEQDHFADAIELMQRLLQVRPEYFHVQLKIAKIYLLKGREDEAAEAAGEAFDGFLEQGEIGKCAEALELIEQVNPESILSTLKRAEFMVQQGEVDKALALFRDGAEALEEDGQRQDFLRVGERMLELDPSLDDVRAKVAETLLAEAEAFVNYRLFDKAVNALARAIKYDPNQVESYMTLARVLVEAGRGDDAVDMAILATHQVEGDDQKRELLLLIWELTRAREQVENLAQEMDIDLELDVGASWPIPERAPAGLGNEETSPIQYSDEFCRQTQEETTEHGPIIGDSSVVNNLVSLFGLAASMPRTGRLLLCEPGESAAFAEIVVSGGRVHLGVRIRECLFVDEESRQHPAELVEKLERLSEVTWQSIEDPDLARAEEAPASTASEKCYFRAVTARALVEIARHATTSPLGTSFVKVANDHPSSVISFSLTSLLKAAADSMVTACETRSVLLDEVHEFSEESWLLLRPREEEGFLPLEHGQTTSTSVEETLAVSDVASQLAGQVDVFRQFDGSRSNFVGISFVFSDGAWSALIDDDTAFLARSSNNSIGTLLRCLRSKTDGEST